MISISIVARDVRRFLLLFLIFTSLMVRLAVALRDHSIPEKDAAEYDRLALDLSQGKGYRNEKGELSAWRPPLYPFFLSAIYKAGGHSYLNVRIVQAVLSAAIVAVIFLLARLLFGTSAAYWAAAISSVYPAFYAYYFSCASLSAETLYTFLLVFSFYEYFRFACLGKGADLVFSGILMGLAILTRPVPALLAAAFPFLFFLAGYRPPKLWLTFLLFWTAVGLTLLPWTLRNYVVFREFVPVTTLGGANFYLGNHAGADGMGGSRDPGLDFYKEVYYPQDAALDAAGKSETEKARYFYRKGREFVFSEPAQFAALYLRKLALYVDPRISIGSGPDKRVIFEPGYLFVLAGALAALWRGKLSAAERRAAIVFTGILLYFWGIHGLTVATGRFRFPVEPLLVILASRAFPSGARAWPHE
jgi:4-amino-4-deoxy-L-arabinose transferase-like glycosyltransferase